MAETSSISPQKRHREEEETLAEEESMKRQKSSSSYNQILSLLDDTDEPNQPNNDLTSLINTLHQEISSQNENDVISENDVVSCSSSSSLMEGDKEKMMKHLLEASDDELGIPNTEFGGSNYEIISSEDYYVNGNSLFDGFDSALWEFEDETANYYTLLQSELFM